MRNHHDANAKSIGGTAELLGGKGRLIPIREQIDQRGCLVPFDFDSMTFAPRRAFVIRDVPAGVVRGGHALRRQQMLLVCLAGRVEVRLICRNGEETVVLDTSSRALFVDAGVWSEQRYIDPGTCLCVFASGPYDPGDYMDAPE